MPTTDTDARDRAVAEAVVKAWHAEWLTSGALKGLPDEWVAALADRITAALATARAEERAKEREGCARTAERVVPRHTECGNKIAAALRARGEG